MYDDAYCLSSSEVTHEVMALQRAVEPRVKSFEPVIEMSVFPNDTVSRPCAFVVYQEEYGR
jgi:hypothetical protein